MDRLPVAQMNPLSLAFVGDAVYSLWMREAAAWHGGLVGGLHNACVALVNAAAQAEAARQLMPHLTEQEQGIYRRGRNAQVGTAAKGGSLADYHAATGLEALFGYLYLDGQEERARALFALIHPDR